MTTPLACGGSIGVSILVGPHFHDEIDARRVAWAETG